MKNHLKKVFNRTKLLFLFESRDVSEPPETDRATALARPTMADLATLNRLLADARVDAKVHKVSRSRLHRSAALSHWV